VGVAAGVAQVQANKALVLIACRGDASCQGVVKLVVRIKAKRAAKRRGKRRIVKRNLNVVIGKARFSIPVGGRATIRVKLTGKGRALLRHAGKRGLTVRLTGTGIKGRTIHLKSKRRTG